MVGSGIPYNLPALRHTLEVINRAANCDAFRHAATGMSEPAVVTAHSRTRSRRRPSSVVWCHAVAGRPSAGHFVNARDLHGGHHVS